MDYATTTRPVWWSYGGGTQSAAIAVMILQGVLPRPDGIVMADTGREMTRTWTYLSEFVQPALSEIGLTVEIVPHSYSYWDLVKGDKGDVLIPAFVRSRAGVGKLDTFCSNEWKQRPIRRWLTERGVRGLDLWLGMSTDEIERMKHADKLWLRHVYPLIEMVPTSRHQCVAIVEKYGWPTPPKSRCWMCPNMGPRGWRELRDDFPDDFAKAVALESEIHLVDPEMWLHKLAIPLVEAVEQSDLQADLFDGCDSGYCFA